MKSTLRTFFASVFVLLNLVLSSAWSAQPPAQIPAQSSSSIQLSSQCPASFENRDGHCKLVSNYTQYASLENAGVGGLKTGLPAIRDGFSAKEIDLGRYLFFDPILSGNGKQACASCASSASVLPALLRRATRRVYGMSDF
jgi:cytochrome c peroxidase